MYFYCNNFVQPQATNMNLFMETEVLRWGWVFLFFLEGSDYEVPSGDTCATYSGMYLRSGPWPQLAECCYYSYVPLCLAVFLEYLHI